MESDVQVWWATLVATDRALLDLLDRTERTRVESLERPADQGRSMVAAALLRVVAGAHLGVAPEQVVIDRTCAECGRPHGRPRVLGPGAPVPYVSVSHSGLLVVVALAAHVPVGVDVQRVADVTSTLRGQDDGGAEDWVRREAITKLGCPGAQPEVRRLPAPLDGYAAALATPLGASRADLAVQVRHWPDETPGPGLRPPRRG